MGTFTVGLVPHPTKSVAESVAILCAWKQDGLPGKGDVLLIALQSDEHRVAGAVELVDERSFRDRVDVVVALGGDGTMLGAMRLVADRPVPVLGVNYGNLGFLVEVEPADLPDALERLAAKRFSLEPHHAVEVVHSTSTDEHTFLAFNDVSIARRPGEGVVTADLVVDGTPYGHYKADAIIVATSAGSTAYNYAAGGPVMSPAVAATLITPVAPMSGIDRSVVLGPGEALRFQVGAGTRSAALEVDGRVVADVSEGCVVSMRLQREAGQVIRFDAGRHATKGRLKLSLLDLPLREDQLLELVPSDVRAKFKARTAHRRGGLVSAAQLEAEAAEVVASVEAGDEPGDAAS
jgi:NAD+ kinase